MTTGHGSRDRLGDLTEVAAPDTGRYRPMLGNIPVFTASQDEIIELAKRMREQAATDPGPAPTASSGWGGGVNPPPGPPSPPDPLEPERSMPAGYTYLGQFIDHDITFDPTSQLDRSNDPRQLVNFRTPRLDLDSLYGRGRADDPFLYEKDPSGRTTEKFLLGSNNTGVDLPRNEQGVALTGDPRNDENTFVSQLHVLWLRFHNVVVDWVAANEGLAGSDLFKRAHQLVRWHYQWVVAHDYLPRVTGTELHARLLFREPHGENARRRFYRPTKHAYMPVEFSAAAFRFGHSQVRGTYQINDVVPELPAFRRDAGPLEAFHGFRPLPEQWQVDWRFFFETDPQRPPQLSRPIDTRLSQGLFELPGHDGDDQTLPALNLRRGLALGLPAGEDVARAMGVQPLDPSELSPWSRRGTPLWFYILKEAEVRHGGAHLGEVGGRIVGETLLGLLELDPLSYIAVQPDWLPVLPTAVDDPAAFAMRDVIDLVNRL